MSGLRNGVAIAACVGGQCAVWGFDPYVAVAALLIAPVLVLATHWRRQASAGERSRSSPSGPPSIARSP
jgi:hypothetical protein